MTNVVACINGQSAGNVTQLLLRGIIWNYSQVKEIRLVTEMPQIENQNVFRPFPSYDVLRSWFTSQSDYRLHYFTLIEISLPMSYKTIQ